MQSGCFACFFSDVLVAVASSDLIAPSLILSKTFNMVY